MDVPYKLYYDDVYCFEEYRDDAIYSLFYEEADNILVDMKGNPVFNIWEFVTPGQLYLFKKKKEWMLLDGKNGRKIELVWPEHYED